MQRSKRAFAARTRFGFTPRMVFSALTLVLGGSANAADFSMPFKAPPPSPAFSWTGFYIGADVGYAWGKDTTTEYLTAANTFTGFNPSYNVHSAVGRLYG